MISKWQWIILQFTRKIWVRAALFAVLAVATALLAIVLEELIPLELPRWIGADAVNHILDILATSMLAVTTFSLSVMVAAYSAATSNVTPRATKLLMQDTTAQNVLATFIGSFMFSLVGIVAISTGAYSERGLVVLFIVTVAVITLIIVTIIRWTEHLSRLGRVGETTDRVEAAASKAIVARAGNPCLGGRQLNDPEHDIPRSATPIYAARTGYVEHIDVAALSACAEKAEADVYIWCLPGAFVHAKRPLAWVDGVLDDEASASLRSAFSIDDERSFDQDPRFGLSVLAEIASRALSPALNDPGTAIDVIGRAVRILTRWSEGSAPSEQRDVSYPRIWIAPIQTADLFDDIFMPIARDGAAHVDVQIRLHKALAALAQIDAAKFADSAARHARLALIRAEAALAIEEDKIVLRELARQLDA